MSESHRYLGVKGTMTSFEGDSPEPFPQLSRRLSFSYQPVATRVTVLLLFATLLATCVGLIETIFWRSDKPSMSPLVASKTTSLSVQSTSAAYYASLTEATPSVAATTPIQNMRRVVKTTTIPKSHNLRTPESHLSTITTSSLTVRATATFLNPGSAIGTTTTFETSGTTFTTRSPNAYVLISSTPSGISAVTETNNEHAPTDSTYTKSQTTVATNNATMIPWTIESIPSSSLVVNQPVTHTVYFMAMFLAPLLAVLIKIFWEIIQSGFELIEPFQCMTKHGGSSAKNSLFAHYLSCSTPWNAIKTLSTGRLLTPLVTMLSFFVSVLATLAASSMTTYATANCPTNIGYMRCHLVWVVDPVIFRCLESFLIVCMVMILLVVGNQLKSKPTGLCSNPASIASLAALLNQDKLIRDLCVVDPDADSSTFAAAMQEQKIRLRYHQHDDGKRYYGITSKNSKSLKEKAPDERLSLSLSLRRSEACSRSTNRTTQPAHFWPSLRFQCLIFDTSQLITSLGLSTVVLVYLRDGESDVFNDFFNSNTWLPRFILVAIASLVDVQWKRLEREVRTTEPYRRLAKGSADAETTILLKVHGTCWSQLPASIRRLLRYRDTWFQTTVTIITALSDINVVAAAGIAFSNAQTKLSLEICGYLSVGITASMTCVTIITMAWWRMHDVIKLMPRSPDTIGNVLSYLCTSHMSRELAQAQMEELPGNERDRLVLNSSEKFWFGRAMGTDGVERWSVDFDRVRNRADNTDIGVRRREYCRISTDASLLGRYV